MKVVLQAAAIAAAVTVVAIALVMGGMVVVMGIVLPSGPGCDAWNGQRELELATSVIQADIGGSKIDDTKYDCDSSREPRGIYLSYDIGRDEVEAVLGRLDYCRATTEPHTWECTPKGRAMEVRAYLDRAAVSLKE